MYFLFSGEGPTDLGSGRSGLEVDEHLANHFEPGPLAHLVDQLIQAEKGFSPLETLHCGFVSEAALSRRKAELRPSPKSLGLSSPRRRKETRYFYNNARILARIAREKRSSFHDNEEVVAILFRDTDVTSARGDWNDKYQSMLDGFAEEGRIHGVPMLANPKSEAWLLCALQDQPYRDCEKWERAAGNDRSPHALKTQLEERLGRPATCEHLCGLVIQGKIEATKIDMPSFRSFRDRLHRVIAAAG